MVCVYFRVFNLYDKVPFMNTILEVVNDQLVRLVHNPCPIKFNN